MIAELDGSSCATDVELLKARIPNERYDSFLHDLKVVFLHYAEGEVTERKKTRRTVCKTNVLNAIHESYRWGDGGFYDVNDEWMAGYLGSDWKHYTFELHNWKLNDSVYVEVEPRNTDAELLEEATRLLLEEYEKFIGKE